jgi:hypothetical protein
MTGREADIVERLAKKIANVVGNSKASHSDKQLALFACVYALGNPPSLSLKKE